MLLLSENEVRILGDAIILKLIDKLTEVVPTEVAEITPKTSDADTAEKPSEPAGETKAPTEDNSPKEDRKALVNRFRAFVNASDENGKTAKETLAGYGVKTITKLSTDQLRELVEKVGA